MLMMRTLEGAEKEEEEEEEERYSLCLESSNVGCHHGHWRMERVFESMCLQQHAALQQRCVCRGCACQWPRAAPCSCTPAPPSAQPSTTNSNNFAFPCLFARIAPCSSRSARATRLREPHILLPKLCSVHASQTRKRRSSFTSPYVFKISLPHIVIASITSLCAIFAPFSRLERNMRAHTQYMSHPLHQARVISSSSSHVTMEKYLKGMNDFAGVAAVFPANLTEQFLKKSIRSLTQQT